MKTIIGNTYRCKKTGVVGVALAQDVDEEPDLPPVPRTQLGLTPEHLEAGVIDKRWYPDHFLEDA